MAITASVNLSIQVPGGPTLSMSSMVAVDTYDRSTVTVPKTTGDVTVNLLSGVATDVIKFVLITASKYDVALTYKFGGAGFFKITEPQVLAGGDVVHTLSATPQAIELKNTGTDDIIVDIFVLRKAQV